MNLRLDIIWQEAPQFAAGLGNTVWMCAMATVLSLLFGMLMLPPLISKNAYLSRAARWLVDAGRCIPFLLLTYLVYFGLRWCWRRNRPRGAGAQDARGFRNGRGNLCDPAAAAEAGARTSAVADDDGGAFGARGNRSGDGSERGFEVAE